MGTITKALELLNFFSRRQPEIGLSEFVQLAGRDKATVHRHLTELLENGFLEQHPITRAYRLGPAILRLSGVREATYPMRSVLRPLVERVAKEIGELTHVSLLQGETLSPIYDFDPAQHGTQVAFDEAEILPLHATSSGLVVLAFGDPAVAKRVLSRKLQAFTNQTITDPASLREMLTTIRKEGIASLNRSFDDEVVSQAAPIFDSSGHVIGAVAIAIPSIRDTAEKRAEIRAALYNASKQMTHSLGGIIPTPSKAANH